MLSDYSGKGYKYSMVTANCRRPNRAVKLLDFLYSEEGQRPAYFGKKNADGQDGTFEYTVRPGERR
ncbi:MAG: hypothetical protein LBL66_05425 [Clostridiales bacterium]|nr:hypothetical protein [Clostridiales bacterium]